MAILRGFPPSNTISPTTRIPDDEVQKLYPQKPDIGSKNPWIRNYKQRVANQPCFSVRTKVVVPDAKLLAQMKAAAEAACQGK